MRKDPRASLVAVARAAGGVTEVADGVWLVSDPALTERLLANEDALTARADLRTAVTDWGQDGLTSWMAARRAMRPALASSGVAWFVPVMVDLTRQVLARWPSSGVVDGMREAVAVVSAINTHYVLGEPSETVSTLVADELDAAERAGPASPRRRRRRRLDRAQRRTYSAVLDHVRGGRTGRRGLLDVLDDDERTVALALRTMLLSGHRVPAAALAWAFHELATHPDAQERARREAVAHRVRPADDRNPTAGLRYCQAVVRETLRLHPPVWRFERQLATPATVGGGGVRGGEFPAGATLRFSNHVNQRDQDVYPDPDEFRPERWRGPEPQPAPGSYFPFGLGPRFCPGSGLALTELTVVLATVLGEHRLAPYRSPGTPRGVLDAPVGLRLRVTRT